MAIKALFFDFFGTIARENDTLAIEICRRISEAAAQVVVPADVARYWQQVGARLQEQSCAERFIDMEQMERRIMADVVAHFQARIDADALAGELLAVWQRPELYPDVRVALTRPPLPICLVVNADTRHAQAAIKHVQLSFDHIVTSQDARCYKPGEAIFTHALQRMGVAPQEGLFIGDSLHYDIEGARGAGMLAAWCNRTGRTLGSHILPDATLTNLLDLRRLIK